MLILHPLFAQWSTSGDLDNRRVNEFLVKDSLLFAGTDGGVFRSTDNGATWTQVNNGLTDTTIVALAVSGSMLFAGDWVNGVFRSSDNGDSWAHVSGGMSDTFVSDILVSGTTLFAGTADGGGIYRSTNNGGSWGEITSGLGSHDGIVLARDGTDILLGDDECLIFRTTNNGDVWIQASTGLPGAYISSLVVSGANLFAGTSRGVLLSTDNGAHWVQVNNGLTDTSVNVLTLSGTDLFAGTLGGVFRSANNGASWTQHNGGLTDTNVTALVSFGAQLFAGTETSGVYQGLLSVLPVELASLTAEVKAHGVEVVWTTATEINNYGFEIERRGVQSCPSEKIESPEWKKIAFLKGNGTTNSPKEYSYFDNNIPEGKYCYRLKQIDRDGKFEYSPAVEVMRTSAINEFTLAQNYPNPFNPSTVISYRLPINGHVAVKVFDALGREAATLVDEVQEAGRYTVKFDASRFSGGFYFYTLKAANVTVTRKMVLIK